MAKEQKAEQPEKREVKTLGDRRIIKVSVFQDEYEKLGLTSEMELKEGVSTIRSMLELDPNRQKMGNPKNVLMKEIKEKMTFEELQEIVSKLKTED